MTDPVGPVSRSPRPRRLAARRDAANPGRRAADKAALLPVPTDEVAETLAPPPPPLADAAFAAQVMGQGGQKRGLRGGKPVLDHAREAYLETEWSGRADRRIARGKIAKTEI